MSPSTPANESKLRNLFFRLVFLAAPKDSDRRRFERHACSFPVQISFRIGDQEQVVAATALDLSIGGMLVDGVQIPDGVIRTQVQFEIPADVLPGAHLVRSVKTSAAIRYRDQENKTLSLSFAESLRIHAPESFIGQHWLSLLLLSLLAILIPLALWIKPLAKYVEVWGIGFGVTLVLTPLVRWVALKLGAVDVPDERRPHRVPTPRGGGLAVVVGFYAAALAATSFTWDGRVASMNSTWLHGYLMGSAVLVLVGILDDVRGLRPLTKLSGQLLAAGLMFALGHSMGRLLGFALPWWMDLLVTLVWFVALTNAFNLIDGLDGLATGLALVAGLGLMGAFFCDVCPATP